MEYMFGDEYGADPDFFLPVVEPHFHRAGDDRHPGGSMVGAPVDDEQAMIEEAIRLSLLEQQGPEFVFPSLLFFLFWWFH